ncbi:MAG: hypothetical protein WC554_09675 [Clostridia bacterium]|jgi:hypothetical protein
MNPHEFFQNIVVQQQQPQQADPPYLQHNYVVLEINNNWSFVRWLMCRYREGWLKQLDQMEQLWYNFLVGNNIDIESYKNNEEFLKSWLKTVPN